MPDGELEILKEENIRLRQELDDMRILNETTIEHSTALENELVEQNMLLNGLQNKMKKYLSSQLYNALVGGKQDASLVYTRKKLTIFFSDIVGFSEITDSIESELLSEVLNQYLNRMSVIATEWGGTVDKFIGDAVMVFFGDPEFIDDATHARKCVNMALTMLEELRDLRIKWQSLGLSHNLQVRIGINTGFCTVGNFGSNDRLDYTIIGGQVNAAARLQSIAGPDSIYISNATYTLLGDEFECEYLGNMTVKGIHAPIDVYKVLGLRGKIHDENLNYFTQKTKLSFILKEIDFDVLSTQTRKREEIKKALNKAFKIIDQAEKLEKQKQKNKLESME